MISEYSFVNNKQGKNEWPKKVNLVTLAHKISLLLGTENCQENLGAL